MSEEMQKYAIYIKTDGSVRFQSNMVRLDVVATMLQMLSLSCIHTWSVVVNKDNRKPSGKPEGASCTMGCVYIVLLRYVTIAGSIPAAPIDF